MNIFLKLNLIMIICKNNVPAGVLEYKADEGSYYFSYFGNYAGKPVSLLLRELRTTYEFDVFPAILENLLPEGFMLEALLGTEEIGETDFLKQILTTGNNLYGDITIYETLPHNI